MNEPLWQKERAAALKRAPLVLKMEIEDLEKAQAQAIVKVAKITKRLHEARKRSQVR